MQTSLPARPSLEQLKKLAKDLVKNYTENQPETLALIRQHLPALAGKTEEEIAAYSFALHDAQSVIARHYGFSSWNELHEHVEALQKAETSGPTPPLDVAAKLRAVSRAYEQKDYALFCSVMSEEMKAKLPQDRFESSADRLSAYFKPGYRITYMGSVKRSSRPVFFGDSGLKAGIAIYWCE
jgi:transketolase